MKITANVGDGEYNEFNGDNGNYADRPDIMLVGNCLLYTSPSPRDRTRSRMPSSA